MTETLTTTRTAARVRQDFIDFFATKHGHAFVPSSPVVPHDDPTLMFANAGMNQFKDVFLGHGDRPYQRAVNSQKCIRAGGKHNDLEDVGKDHYHHTFFEMLGNWSFGDYFKAEAIEWAWTLLTEVWGIPRDRLYITVFAGDETDGLDPDTEAETIWKQYVDPARISRWDRKDNFWEMGDVGPCGPCSEIHYDGRPDAQRRDVPGDALVNRDHPDLVEIWNLVFIQFNRAGGREGRPGPLTPLPAKHVDTGMGLERIVRVLQGCSSNYDTDLWTPIFDAIQAHADAHPYRGSTDDPVDVAYRVIADHVRCLTVAITDGGRPSNEKGGYVLRRILRRGVRHAHQTLGVKGPLLCKLVPAVVESLGDAFHEMKRNPTAVADIIHDEEESFLRTLDRGLALFADAADRSAEAGTATVSAADAFRLHDTYGFPIDLTRVMAEERGMTVDESGYETLMEEARNKSRRGGQGETAITLPPEAIARLGHLGIAPTVDDEKYRPRPLTVRVEAIWNGTDFDNRAHIGRPVALILNRTNHYAESGGQVGDEGVLTRGSEDFGTIPGRGFGAHEGAPDFRFRVHQTRAEGGYVLHIGTVVEGEIQVGDSAVAQVDLDRRNPAQANHTSTHLLNHALREVLGDDVQQKGSLVAPDRLRFDFTCPHAMSDEQIMDVQNRVNGAIGAGLVVHAGDMPLERAMGIAGVRAVFGERYPDPVRVVSIGALVEDLERTPGDPRWRDFSIEFCGGTHLNGAGEARRFVIVHEQALAAGVRRITALTGPAAMAADAAGRDLLARIETAAALDGDALVDEFNELARLDEELTLAQVDRHRITAQIDELRGRVKSIQKQSQAGARDEVVAQARQLAETAGGDFIVAEVAGADKETLLAAMDVIRAKCPGTAAMLFSPDHENSKVSITAIVPPELIARGLKAGDWVRQAAQACGGGGGGRPDMAQAGGKDPARTQHAMDAASDFAEQSIQ
jgi:alanyl-tRNA synthetase